MRVLQGTAQNALENPAIRGIVIVAQDITERKNAERQLAFDALHDPLTGLENRRQTMAHINAWRLNPELGPDVCAVVWLFDLDQFKAINDTYGHSIGDGYLRKLAERVMSSLPKTYRSGTIYL